jgi:uncharacterized protein YndB with AHSA1/START domain
MKPFEITRALDAPRDKVWKAWTEAERRTFEAGRDSMQQGWTGTFEQLEQYLAR